MNPKVTKLEEGTHTYECEGTIHDATDSCPAIYEIENPSHCTRWVWLCQACFDKWEAQQQVDPNRGEPI